MPAVKRYEWRFAPRLKKILFRTPLLDAVIPKDLIRQRHNTSLRIHQQGWSESRTCVPKILCANNYCNVRTKCDVTIQASCPSGQRPAAGSQSSGSIKWREFYEPFKRDTAVWSSSACCNHFSLSWKITLGRTGESCKSITHVLNLLYMNCTFQEKKATTFSSCFWSKIKRRVPNGKL